MKHVSIRVVGRVQGVGFRAAVRVRAQSLGLAGFVKNLNDGSVFMAAEGNAADVERFANWARKGPAAARVADVQISYSTVLRKFEDFEIRYW